MTLNKKFQVSLKGKKQSEEIMQALLGPDSNMAENLELSNLEFFVNYDKTLRALLEKVDSMQEQMCNVSRVMETLRKIKKKS